MPVRDRAVEKALTLLLGTVHYRGDATGHHYIVQGETLTEDEWQRRYRGPVDYIYQQVVDSIDWNRVFLEATSRHIAQNHEDRDYGMICEECINEVLLATSTWQNWRTEPMVPRVVYDPEHGEYTTPGRHPEDDLEDDL